MPTPAAPTPSPADLAALARSSPWLWSALRFTVSWRPGSPTRREPVRAWLRRPDRLRVETLGGALVQVVRESRATAVVLTTGGGRTVHVPWARDPSAPRAVLRPDGLVARRPGPLDMSHDPMFRDYRWVSVLDPVELADGHEEWPDADGRAQWAPALDVGAVAEVQHGGRPAWEAVVAPTPHYEPRCPCCPLLATARIDELEWGSPQRDAYPEAFRVRLDVGTGVCVLTEEIGGTRPGGGHDLRIEAVDEPVDEALFRRPRRRGGRFPGPGLAPVPR